MRPPPDGLPFFACGSLLPGESLGWVAAGAVVEAARVRGGLWRLPGGEVWLGPGSRRVEGLLLPPRQGTRLGVLHRLLVEAGEGLEWRVLDASTRRGARPVLVLGLAGDPRRSGARPLEATDWRRFRP